MVVFEKGKKSSEESRKESIVSYDKDTRTIIIDARTSIYPPSIEDYEIWMSTAIDALLQYEDAQTIVIRQSRDFVYDSQQVELLREIAHIIKRFVKTEKIISINKLTPYKDEDIRDRVAFVQRILLRELRTHPLKAYIDLEREIVKYEAYAKTEKDAKKRYSYEYYLANALLPLKKALQQTKLVESVKSKLIGYKGERDIYREIFYPLIRPNFMITRYMLLPPKNAEKIREYKLKDAKVEIYRLRDKAMYHYHLIPDEFNLDEKKYEILETARTFLSQYKPKQSDFAMPERMREVFYNIGRDLIIEIADNKKISLSSKDIDFLANILVRYTAGYGILEVFLEDENVQDFFINAPIGITPIFINHAEYGECQTNIIPSREDADVWATRFRIESGRPLDESSPVLDTEILLKYARARVAAVTRNLSPDGLSFAFRRHRDRPWTLPLFIKYKMLNPLAAGLISFIVDGARTLLIAGTRGTGKTSLLGSVMVEIPRKHRIVTVEDTLELPVEYLVRLGYNIERLKARSALSNVENEMPADEAIRTSLRLGDSCLIVGEVRSVEAKALYESMRIGALANVVAGTIHGDSPYGVFDRVVNDLEVPRTSFKATDIIIIANRLRSADGLRYFRRVSEITEVRKDWEEDPMREKGFVKLMEYNAKKDALEPTDTLLNGESFILNQIMRKIKDFKDNWELVWENILLRGKMKQYLVEISERYNKPEILEADFVVMANEKFHVITGEVIEDFGGLDHERIFALWKNWVDNAVREYGKQ